VRQKKTFKKRGEKRGARREEKEKAVQEGNLEMGTFKKKNRCTEVDKEAPIKKTPSRIIKERQKKKGPGSKKRENRTCTRSKRLNNKGKRGD